MLCEFILSKLSQTRKKAINRIELQDDLYNLIDKVLKLAIITGLSYVKGKTHATSEHINLSQKTEMLTKISKQKF